MSVKRIGEDGERTLFNSQKDSLIPIPLKLFSKKQNQLTAPIALHTGKEVIHMDFKLSINESKMLSAHISRLCKAVGKEKAQIYARYADLINLAPNLKDNQEESDDEDDFNEGAEEHHARDEPRDGVKNELKDDFRDSFKDELKEAPTADPQKESSRNGEESRTEPTSRKENKKSTTDDRCFMQKFQAALLIEPATEPAADRHLSNYERLKLKLKLQQMMAKPVEKLNKNESKNIQLLSKFVMQSSLTPKSLNDFSRYWQDKSDAKAGSQRTSNRPTTKLLDLIYSSSLLPAENGKAEPSPVDKPKPCTCRVEICIPWYPCEVKYCPRPTAGQTDQTTAGSTLRLTDLNRPNRVRCGIRSCKKCWVFYFSVDSKNSCLWDDEI